MAYRWKTQQPVAPMGGKTAYDAAQAATAMNTAPQGAPVAVEPFQDINAQIRDKEAKLAAIESEIAQIDRQYPEMKAGGQQWEIAAKRAEIGDMSAYDSMMTRGQQAGGQASAIEGELYNAEKLTWGLKSKSSEEREIAAANIGATLRKAEEWAARTGNGLPDSYYRLKKAMDSAEGTDSDYMNSREYGNELALKIYRGTATDDDIEKGVAWAEKNPNSDAAREILEAAKSGKGQTVESKAKAKAFAEKISKMVKSIEIKSPQEQAKWWNGLSQKEKNGVLKIAKWVSGPNGEYLERKK